MDWFLYDNGLRHERVKEAESTIHFSLHCPISQMKEPLSRHSL